WGRLVADSHRRRHRPCNAERFWPRWLAENIGIARHAHLRAHRTQVDVPRGASSGARVCARGRAACARSRDQQVVEGGTPRRVPRLQPERQGPYYRCRILGSTEAGRTRLGTAFMGRDRCVRAWRLHARDDAGQIQARARPTRDNGPAGLLDRGTAGTLQTACEGRTRRRAMATALREAGRGAAACAAVTTANPEAAIDRDRSCREEG